MPGKYGYGTKGKKMKKLTKKNHEKEKEVIMPSKNAPSRKKSLGYYAKVKKGGGRGKKSRRWYDC